MFAVQVVGVERLDGDKALNVFFVHEVFISAFPVPRIEAVIPNHSQGLAWQRTLIFENIV